MTVTDTSSQNDVQDATLDDAHKSKATFSRSPKVRKNTSGNVFARVGLRLVVPIVLVGLWWLLSELPGSAMFVANPWEAVVRVFQDYLSPDPARFFMGEATITHFWPSVGRAMLGLALAIGVGVGVGIALGLSPVLTALFQPLVHLGRSLPSPALLGVFFLLFGAGDSPKVFLIAFSIVWPILFNTIEGVQSIGHVRSQAATVFKIGRFDSFFRIVLPGAAPKVFAGIRISLSLSLIIMIISELQKSENGLGYLLVTTQRTFDYTGFWSVLVVLGFLGVVLNLGFKVIERRALKWHIGVTQQND